MFVNFWSPQIICWYVRNLQCWSYSLNIRTCTKYTRIKQQKVVLCSEEGYVWIGEDEVFYIGVVLVQMILNYAFSLV